MSKISSFAFALALAIAALSLSAARAAETPDWSIKATIIEACSCPQLCQCYFNTTPASHEGHGEHDHGGTFCRFNNAFRVEKGHYGDVKLDGAKYWMAGDLGHDLTNMEFEWAEVTFDPSVTEGQREGIKEILKHVYPAKWGSFTFAKDLPMEWKGGKDRAEARLDGGKGAEIILNRTQGMKDGEPVVVKNLKYWGLPAHDGFVLMGNQVEAYRVGKKAFEFKGTTGFMLTFDVSSKDFAKK